MNIYVFWHDRIRSLRRYALFPRDDGFWYHLRMAQQFADIRSRKEWDIMSYAPAGRRSDTYPPLLHHLLGWLIVLTRYLKLKVTAYQIAASIGIVSFALLGINLAVSILLSKATYAILFLLLTSPIIVLRLGWTSLRGEILVIPVLPLVIYLLSMDISLSGLVFLTLLSIYALFSSKTALTVVEVGTINSFLLYFWTFDKVWLLQLTAFMASYFIWFVYSRQKKLKVVLPSAMQLKIIKAKYTERTRYPRIKGDIIISEEELPPSIKELFFFIPLFIPAVIALFLAPNSLILLVCKIQFLYYLIKLGMGKRYLLYIAVPTVFLASSIIVLYPAFFPAFMVWNLLNLLIIKNPDNTGVYEGLKWIRENASKESLQKKPIIAAWWYHGHIISGYGGFRNLWDSYYPDVKKFLEKEVIFDHIVHSTNVGKKFCSDNNVEYLILEPLRVKNETKTYPCCFKSKNVEVYYVGVSDYS